MSCHYQKFTINFDREITMKKIIKRILHLIIICNIAMLNNGIAQAKAPIKESISGLLSPESVVQAEDGTIYVSEINEFGLDGDGQIKKIDRKGNVTVFAKGLDDPKGLALIQGKLYVADNKRILQVKSDGNWQVFVSEDLFPNTPQFLNDLEADKYGNLYVSDSGTLKSGGAIYKINRKGEVVTVVDSSNPDILAPNGLLFEGRNNLLAVDFESGVLYRVNVSTGKTKKIAEGFGGGDGIVKDKKGIIYVSDWKNGDIFKYAAGAVRILKSDYNSPADISLSQDGNYLLIPVMKAGTLETIKIN